MAILEPYLHPKVKVMLREWLNNAVYKYVDQKEYDRITAVVVTNTTLMQYGHASFSYKGEFYNRDWQEPKRKTNRLHESLHGSMDAILAEKRYREFTEAPYIDAFFRRMLSSSNSILDYQKILPTFLHPILNSVHASHVQPRQMNDEQIKQFLIDNDNWLTTIKRRMFLDMLGDITQ